MGVAGHPKRKSDSRRSRRRLATAWAISDSRICGFLNHDELRSDCNDAVQETWHSCMLTAARKGMNALTTFMWTRECAPASSCLQLAHTNIHLLSILINSEVFVKCVTRITPVRESIAYHPSVGDADDTLRDYELMFEHGAPLGEFLVDF